MQSWLRLLIPWCVGIALLSSPARADEERLEDCVGSTPDVLMQEDGLTGYTRVKKNKFKIVESGVTEGGRKVVATSSRCTREIRKFQFEFSGKGHALDDTAYWLKQATEAMRKLKVTSAFRRRHHQAVATLKAADVSRAPASVAADGKGWEKPLKFHVKEGYRAVYVSVEKKGKRKFLLTVSDETSM